MREVRGIFVFVRLALALALVWQLFSTPIFSGDSTSRACWWNQRSIVFELGLRPFWKWIWSLWRILWSIHLLKLCTVSWASTFSASWYLPSQVHGLSLLAWFVSDSGMTGQPAFVSYSCFFNMLFIHVYSEMHLFFLPIGSTQIPKYLIFHFNLKGILF